MRAASIHRFANPGRFMRISGAVAPWVGILTVVLFVAGLYYALLASPADYQQGESVRIMYIHVPSATLGLGVYVFMAVMSFVFLVWRHPLAEVAARAASPIGAAFTLIALVTGSIWGKPTWGTWWVWDARLTSFLILFFLYLGHMALANAFDEPSRGAKAAAILALVGVVNIPIIKFSVDWWNTLHQPASITTMDVAIDPAMMPPLALMAGAFIGFFITFLLVRMKSDLLASRLRAAQLARPPEPAMDLGDLGNFDWHGLLVLNGYGRYVWPAYGVALVVLLAVAVQSVRSLRRRRAALEALLPSERRARGGDRKAAGEPRPGAQRPAPPGPRPERPA